MLSLLEMLYLLFRKPQGRFLLLCMLTVVAGIHFARWIVA